MNRSTSLSDSHLVNCEVESAYPERVELIREESDGLLEVVTAESIPGVIGLHVKRSPILRDSDEQYAPVAQFIRDHDAVEISRETYPRPDFMFGECVHFTYLVVTDEYRTYRAR